MKAIRMSFIKLLLSVKSDAMLFVICFVPLLCGLAFKFFIPYAEGLLKEQFLKAAIISPYYSLFDILLSMIAPIMFCFVASMVVLEETDEHIAEYLFVTPLRKGGYLLSRIGLPAMIAFIVTMALLPPFKLTELNFICVFFLALNGTIQGIIISMLIVSFSSNKLEGMAIAKLSFLLQLGAVGPYFLKENVQYLLFPLPSFWMAKAVYEKKLIYYIVSFIVSGFWILLIRKYFLRKTKK